MKMLFRWCCFIVMALTGSGLVGCQSVDLRQEQTQAVSTARTLEVAKNAWAGSSVNVLANVKQTLFTDSVYQYTGFYDQDGRLVLGKRRIGEDHWELNVTEFSGNVVDAHNHISLVVDGDGYLHVAWDHHNSPLKYARSTHPGGLQLASATMLGTLENSVTYPQFYHLQNGDVLFQYRDGGSGRGNLVLNRYRTQQQSWLRVQNNLLDGQGQRSAYWDMHVDARGVLHLAWIWRETPDVASNHDLHYARSDDYGQSWQSVSGLAYSLSMNSVTVKPVLKIASKHNLMNPPVIAADGDSQPYIASYWSDTPDSAPAFGVITFRQNRWQLFRSPEITKTFRLSGMGTKNPLWSRPLLLIESDWKQSWFHLVFRDSDKQAIMVGSVFDLDKPEWQERQLLNWPADGWEPSYDPTQWQRMKQLHMLLQHADQQDGNDAQAAKVTAQSLKLLIWSPAWERMQNSRKDDVLTDASSIYSVTVPDLQKSQILDLTYRTALWQWQNIPAGWNYHPRGWALCPLYIGSLAMDSWLPQAQLAEKVREVGRAEGWQTHERPYDADDYCVVQAYLSLYEMDHDERQIQPALKHLSRILNHLPNSSLDWGTPQSRNRWSWSDALFMGPVGWIQAYQITNDQRFADYANHEWWQTYQRLFNPDTGLYFRDESYLDLREKNGQPIHWSRGNGWAIGGLVRLLERLPTEHPDYEQYTLLFKTMAAAFKQAQQSDGLWRAGLLDPVSHDSIETSGSAFAVFALAWGINHGMLDKTEYLLTVMRGWAALSQCVLENGKLIHVQAIGAAPEGFDPQNAEPFATGALLLAASEVIQLAAE